MRVVCVGASIDGTDIEFVRTKIPQRRGLLTNDIIFSWPRSSWPLDIQNGRLDGVRP